MHISHKSQPTRTGRGSNLGGAETYRTSPDQPCTVGTGSLSGGRGWGVDRPPHI